MILSLAPYSDNRIFWLFGPFDVFISFLMVGVIISILVISLDKKTGDRWGLIITLSTLLLSSYGIAIALFIRLIVYILNEKNRYNINTLI